MSFRFHLSKPIISLFHDPANPASRKALALIKAAARKPPPSISRIVSSNDASAAATPSPSAALKAAAKEESDVDAFLKEAAADPSDSTYNSLFDLEVVEHDPTGDQFRTIKDTTKLGVVSKEDVDLLGLKTSDLANDVLVVDWDGNRSATNLRGVQELLEDLHKERGRPRDPNSQSGGGGCVII
ncbi:hypothetical protein OC846_006314 [Tilletia horrida]|uniref:Uncharacterized protein n=1 Tax=Tilletia horrida TaxID=155126 RepID=A0AAN6GL85_9BASI|nr:hypothetical protein OC846_006314 [Tilletia horrida]KAK0550727.1 hypothetical protein OC845_002502 [Tilletia horrida]KAK0562181.1 hypothetical protein OC861_005452 [Tilletia horrida]